MPFCCIGGTLRLFRPLTCGVVLVVLVLLQQLRRLMLHQITELSLIHISEPTRPY